MPMSLRATFLTLFAAAMAGQAAAAWLVEEPLMARVGLVVHLLYGVLGETIFRTKKAGAGLDENKGSVAPKHDGTLVVAAGVGLVSQVVPSLVLGLAVHGVHVPGNVLLTWDAEWSMLAFMACGIVLRYWSMAVLGDRFTRQLQVHAKEHKVCDSGPYSAVRHPGYLANLLVYLGGSLLISSNFLVFAAVLLVFLFGYHLRISVEERMLRREIGVEYKRYCTRVRSRLIWGLY